MADERSRLAEQRDFRRALAGEVLLMLAASRGQQGHDLLTEDAPRLARKAVELTEALLEALGEDQ